MIKRGYRIMAEEKEYGLQVSALRGQWEVDKFVGKEDQLLEAELRDMATYSAFKAKIMVSQVPKEGYDKLALFTDRGVMITGWYVKIIERIAEEDEEDIPIFQSSKLSERRGYMLRSLAGEQKTERKLEIMTSDLEERKTRKAKLTEAILREKKVREANITDTAEAILREIKK
jgi:hypothetical protein